MSAERELDQERLAVAMACAHNAPPSLTAFSVGATLVIPTGTSGGKEGNGAAEVVSTGFSRETGPSDHAEQACLIKYVERVLGSQLESHLNVSDELRKGPVTSETLPNLLEVVKLPKGTVCYSSMEPCGKRASQPYCCADLLVLAGVTRVVYGQREPPTFVKQPSGHQRLVDAGVETLFLPQEPQGE